MPDRIEGVIWDWNGTLLNDIQLCVETMNTLLLKRNLPILTFEQYQNVFTFPVQDYYLKIGFDFEKEPFNIPATEFINLYNEKLNQCELQNDSIPILKYFQSLEVPQFVLSAMKHEALTDCLDHYKINQYFQFVSGLDNHFATSKIENGHRLISEMKLNPADIVLIGDTLHDFEVAGELGCRCILISHGHQSKEILHRSGAIIIDNLSQLKA